MSAAACKVVIDCSAALVGKLLCLSGLAPIADKASPGSVSPELAGGFEATANRFGLILDDLIGELNAAIPVGPVEPPVDQDG